MTEFTFFMKIVEIVLIPIIGIIFWLLVNTRQKLADMRVELADYRTRVAETFVSKSTLNKVIEDIKDRLGVIDKKLDRALEARK